MQDNAQKGLWQKTISWLQKRPAHLLVITGLLVPIIALRIADPDPVKLLRLNAFDIYQRLAPRTADPEFPVKIVAIDEASIAKFGQWPWPRNILAGLIEKLHDAGAKAIALDLILPEADRLSPATFAEAYQNDPTFQNIAPTLEKLPTLDTRLATAIANTPTVLAFAGALDATGQPGPPKAGFAQAGDKAVKFTPGYDASVANLSILTDKATGLGAANWFPENDQIVRRVPLLMHIGETLYPSLSLEALRVTNDATTVFVKSSGASGLNAFGAQTGIEFVRVAKTVLPTTARGELWLRFAPPDPKRTISAHKVLDPNFDKTLIEGRTVFIGATAIGLHDLRATALNSSVPGVEMHAQALEQMLMGEHVVRPAYALGMELVFLVVIGALIGWALTRSGPFLAAGIAILAILAVALFGYAAYTNLHLLFDPVYPSLSLAAIYATASLTNFVRAEQDRQQVRQAFASYLAPDLVEELANNPEKLRLGGEIREVSLLFADVRSFSRLAEGRDAESLVAFINQLFTPLSEAIVEQRGTIDKYMGDAVMAFWNAPLLNPDHARMTCRAALEMLVKLETLNQELAENAKAIGQDISPIRIGIGLNTGDCCVGNVGSPVRFDYSVLGDPVNVASRLEQLTKTYGVPIIAGEPTAKAAHDFALLKIDDVIPRGKTRPEAIYALFGDETIASTSNFKALAKCHDELQAALKSGSAPEALQAAEACEAIPFDAYKPLLGHYRAQLG
ncbi:MAG: adenylate/guanylate cyclase domain-containing protein [Filomicrobium sp.]